MRRLRKRRVSPLSRVPLQVVYGDTDSVMIKFGTDDLAKSMELAEDAAARVTATFIKPIKLEFEKVYYPYLLMVRGVRSN